MLDMSRPYSKNYIHIKDVDKYFKIDEKSKTMIFTGKKLVVYIQSRWEVHGYLEINDTVSTIGIADLIIDDTYQANLFMLAKIEIAPSEMSTVTVDGLQYQVLTLHTGDRFLCNTEVVKDSKIAYILYVEYISRANMIYTMDYEHLAFLFDQSKPICGANLKVDHVIFEMIYSHLSRDNEKLSIQYRHTDMSKPMKFISIRNISYAPTSTTASMVGSYFSEGLNSSLLADPSESHSLVEDLLR